MVSGRSSHLNLVLLTSVVDKIRILVMIQHSLYNKSASAADKYLSWYQIFIITWINYTLLLSLLRVKTATKLQIVKCESLTQTLRIAKAFNFNSCYTDSSSWFTKGFQYSLLC